MMALGLHALPLGRAGSFWFPPQSSSVAAGHDFVYDLILWLCVAFFVAICGATLYFMVKYRKRPGHKEEITATHNMRLEVTWSIVPLLLLMVVFGISTYWYLEMITPPDEDVHEIPVTAQKWKWTFEYTIDGRLYKTPNMHLIRDRAYQAIMTAPDNDVLHSLFIPAFRVKQDCVPGRFNRVWFRPTELSPMPTESDIGGFHLFCTEYCGDNHSNMLARVYVYENEEQWKAGIDADGDYTKIEDLVERGKAIFESNCASCHSLQPDKVVIGPSWAGTWGTERRFTDGTTAKFDMEYLRESVQRPDVKIVEGFPNGMTPFDFGDRNDSYFEGLAALFKSLSDEGGE
jgi:cytochrome c oxidase subunit 2